MKRFIHAFIVDSGIELVRNFYTDLKHLGVITPNRFQLRVVGSSTGIKLIRGALVTLEGKFASFPLRWKSRITEIKPYGYVDEMMGCFFKKWRHDHRFEDTGLGTTVTDEIEFSFPYPVVGALLEWIAERQLKKIFAYRKDATLSALSTR